jgi:CRP/FNR family cyclic AMP-dependent transcriptional regulator
VDTIASNALGRLYRDGEVIVRQGELGDCMYLILEGKVEVLQRKDEQEYSLAVLEKGDFFGEMGLFDHDVRSATVRALGGAILLTVDKRMFMQRIHEDASFAYKILRRMARRIRELDDLLIRVADTAAVQNLSATVDTAHSVR